MGLSEQVLGRVSSLDLGGCSARVSPLPLLLQAVTTKSDAAYTLSTGRPAGEPAGTVASVAAHYAKNVKVRVTAAEAWALVRPLVLTTMAVPAGRKPRAGMPPNP